MLLSLAYSGDAPPRACPGRGDSVPLAVTASDGTFYLGWTCDRCLAAVADDGLLDIIGAHAK